jgi:hypothetical protein
MKPVIIPRQGRREAASRMAANAPTYLTTTPYKVAALRSGVEPAEDDFVVAIVACAASVPGA